MSLPCLHNLISSQIVVIRVIHTERRRYGGLFSDRLPGVPSAVAVTVPCLTGSVTSEYAMALSVSGDRSACRVTRAKLLFSAWLDALARLAEKTVLPLPGSPVFFLDFLIATIIVIEKSLILLYE